VFLYFNCRKNKIDVRSLSDAAQYESCRYAIRMRQVLNFTGSIFAKAVGGAAGQTPVLAASIRRSGPTMLSAISSQMLIVPEFMEGEIDIERLISSREKLIANNDRKHLQALHNLQESHAKDIAK
jgi:hypothetical protein